VAIIPETGESRLDAAVVTARRIVMPKTFKMKLVEFFKSLLGEKMYKKLYH